MKVGLVGWTQSGKTTIFNSLTGLKAITGGGGRGGSNLGSVKVPDSRLECLSQMLSPPKTTWVEIRFEDMPGPSGAKREGAQTFDSRLLTMMRDADAFAHVVGAYHAPLEENSTSVVKAMKEFEIEMILNDLMQIEKRLERLKKEGKRGSREYELLEKCHLHLEEEKPLREFDFSEDEKALISGFCFLSQKPEIVVVNVSEDSLQTPLGKDILGEAEKLRVTILSICGQLEMELMQLGEDSINDFMSELGLKELAHDRFIRAAYKLLDLISFFTIVGEELRAWTLKRGSTALDAAGKVHTDIQRGFIRAEVVGFDDFEKLGGEAQCKKAGKWKLEGKDYVVQDGDIITFRFNV